MFPASFDYHRPASVAEAIQLLAGLGSEAKLLAGGQSLIPTLKLRLASPDHLIDLADISELREVRREGDHLVIGAMATHRQVETSEVVATALPYLSRVAGMIADPQVRNRGTIGGSIVNSDPAADYPASIVALDAQMVLAGTGGERIVPAADWFKGLMTTAIEDGEILTFVRIPLLARGSVSTYLKLPHPASRFAVVGVAAIVQAAPDGICQDVRLGITGVGPNAFRATSAEQQLLGQPFDERLIAQASERACDDIDVDGDMHFSSDDKRQLCRVHVRRALLELRSRALGNAPEAQT